MSADNFIIRNAVKEDLSAIISLLADDPLGQSREIMSDPVDQKYLTAFAAIERDKNQNLVVAEIGNMIAGCLQITYIPGLSRSGMWRAQIESVRVGVNFRDRGLGRLMIEWAIGQAKNRGCGLVQLTSDKQRPDAVRFYEKLGFAASHEGLKLRLGE